MSPPPAASPQGGPPPAASCSAEALRDLPGHLLLLFAADRPQPNHPAWGVPPAARALVDEVVKAPTMLNKWVVDIFS
ncbi:hypothetical protein Emag_006224 [Eimeria magna]